MAEFYVLANTTSCQMFGCVIKTASKTIVIDGGTHKDGRQLADVLKNLSRSHVDAWFFTHPHHDHIGCFVSVAKHFPEITVGTLYYRFPDLTDPDYAAQARIDVEPALWENVKSWSTRFDIHEISAGETFAFDDVTVRVLRVFNPAILENCINNSSAVYRIEGGQRSVLILGDLGVEGGEETMALCPRELLQADYTQMAHHGQNGVSRAFYEYIQPKRCIWASPDWLWENDQGNGFDTGIFRTVRTREWMEALGVQEHLVEKDGIHKFEI